MNEIALHRGSSPHLNTIDIYVDGQHLTEAVVRTVHTELGYAVLKFISLTVSSCQHPRAPLHILYPPEAPLSTPPSAHLC